MNEIYAAISTICSGFQIVGLVFMISAMVANLRWPWAFVLIGGLSAIAQIFISPFMLQGFGWRFGHYTAAVCGVGLVCISICMMVMKRNK